MFKRWCKDQGFANNSDLSHVLMDGGVLSVPFDKLNDFYEKCVEVYNSGEKLTNEEIYEISEKWIPWRTVACCYMWSAVDPEPVEY